MDLFHRLSANGSLALDNVVAWIDCSLEKVYEAGDHYIVLGHVQELDIGCPDQPLLFFPWRIWPLCSIERLASIKGKLAVRV